MDSALWRLLWIHTRSGLRRTFRGARTIRGAFLLIFTLGVMALWLGPLVFASAATRGRTDIFNFVGMADLYLPLILLAICLMFLFTSAGEKAISFTPSEIDFLFPAPFTRQDLLKFKLAKTAFGLLMMALFFSLSTQIYVRNWVASYVGIVLTGAFLQLVALVTALMGQIVAMRAYNLTRKLILIALALALAAGVLALFRQVANRSIPELVEAFTTTWPAVVLLAPFKVFSGAILARTIFPELVGWALAAAAIDGSLLWLVLRLDADYVESAAAISQKMHERTRRAKQGGGIAMPVTRGLLGVRPRPLPWLWGAGPVAWRQAVLAIRMSRYPMFITLALGAFTVAAPLMAGGEKRQSLATGMGIGFVFYATFIFAMQLPCAFRGDIDHMEVLKSLPISSAAISAGELVGGVGLMLACQLILVVFAIGVGGEFIPLCTVALFLIPLNIVVLAISNSLFLLYPVRLVPSTAADFQFFGRNMLFMLLWTLTLVPALGIAAGAGGLMCWLVGWSWPAFLLPAWLTFAVEIVPILMLLAWTFDRFDPATHTPA
jgi:hypothetical protein